MSFAGYTFFANKVNQTTIAQLQKANSLQQEKITNMSKKTTKLEGYLNNLTSDAQKLKLLSNGSITEKSS
ncbi:hypothetical protein [Pectinatus brassicae]|uniref:Uncharacterized protein n=1 Tax=Pectinatus brassicae TaxID=862415 RepID=A0A840UYZ4_9FIRM|nr:hypothetical protein [Pectinatus brassicae]MBB5337585.1 hypothetical protein [Pectinatus brassicae]